MDVKGFISQIEDVKEYVDECFNEADNAYYINSGLDFGEVEELRDNLYDINLILDDIIVWLKEGDEQMERMNFSKAYDLMKNDNQKVKRPEWDGYWYWDHTKNTIMIHLKTGEELNIFDSNTYEFTLNNIAAEDFEIATSENCKELRG